VRDESDLAACIGYVHANPVKHGYVARPELWPHSTLLAWQERRRLRLATPPRRFYKLDLRADGARAPATCRPPMTASPALTLAPATEADLPFLLALRKSTMTEHLRRAGAPSDDAYHLVRIRHRFEDARIVWADGRKAGLFQGRGLGRRLLAGLLQEADSRAATVDLGVLHGNPARRLYESLGFTPVEEHPLETEMRYFPRKAG